MIEGQQQLPLFILLCSAPHSMFRPHFCLRLFLCFDFDLQTYFQTPVCSCCCYTMVYTSVSVSLFLLLCVCTPCRTQGSQGFALPQTVRGPSLPTVDPDLVKYFDLTGGSRSLVDMMVGPRPGLIPPATFIDPTRMFIHSLLLILSKRRVIPLFLSQIHYISEYF